MEYVVEQRSEEWFALRRNVALTASVFGEALGVGKGKPYHYLLSLLQADNEADFGPYAEHGVVMEPLIHQAYCLLTGHTTRESGFWVPREDDIMHGVIGASPDAIVIGSKEDSTTILGLAEFKAPFYSMYGAVGTIQGIPRRYLAQVMGQMAVCGATWCEFMAVCTRTCQIVLKRVYFHPLYWYHVSLELKQFADILKEAKARKSNNLPAMDFEAGRGLQNIPSPRDLLPGESEIVIEDLLISDGRGRFQGPSRIWLTFEQLMGMEKVTPPSQGSETYLPGRECLVCSVHCG